MVYQQKFGIPMVYHGFPRFEALNRGFWRQNHQKSVYQWYTVKNRYTDGIPWYTMVYHGIPMYFGILSVRDRSA